MLLLKPCIIDIVNLKMSKLNSDNCFIMAESFSHWPTTADEARRAVATQESLLRKGWMCLMPPPPSRLLMSASCM